MSYTPYGVENPGTGTSLSSNGYYVQLGSFFNLSYTKRFDKHQVYANANYFLQHRRNKGVVQDYKRQNMSLTANYNYAGKYYIDAIVSYTGHSSLPEGNRFKAFPTLGGGWILTEEEFLKDNSFVDFLKVRGTWGQMGVFSGASSFLYVTEWEKTGGQFFGSYTENLTESMTTVGIRQDGNPDLNWGTTTELDFGLDAVLLDERLSLQLDYYTMRTEGLVLSAMTPTILGYANYYDNLGENKYQGVDGAIRFSDRLGDLTYAIGGNLGYNVSEVIKDNRPEYTYEWMNRVGNPTDAIYGFVDEGLFVDESEIAASPEQTFGAVLPGNIKYQDLDNSGTIESNLDNKMIGHTRPRFKYGLDLTFAYKGLEFYVLGYGVSARDINTQGYVYYHSYSKNKYSAQIMDNHWTQNNPDPNASHPRLTTGSFPNDNKTSSYWLKNASFFKIKNVELAYTLPTSWVENIGLSNLRVFARGSNLYTISEIKDLDPEDLSMGVTQFPSMMTITGGLNIKF